MGTRSSGLALQHEAPAKQKCGNRRLLVLQLKFYSLNFWVLKCLTCGWKLSNIIMSAPAAAASLPSAVEQHSTSILLLKPHTERATFTTWEKNWILSLSFAEVREQRLNSAHLSVRWRSLVIFTLQKRTCLNITALSLSPCQVWFER